MGRTKVMAVIKSCVVAAALCFGAGAAQAQPAATPALSPASAMSLLTVAVPSTDLARSTAFYVGGLGLTAAGRMETANATEAPLIFPGGGPPLMLIASKAPGAALPVRGMLNRVVLNVPDVKGLEARLAAAGYPAKRPPFEEPQHHIVVGVIEDPDGNVLELVQRNH
jgi:catechol 2,3-dioxygenase-like lactoylglutathione lyase family enzyme